MRFLTVYVLLSRVRRLDELICVDMSDKIHDVIEAAGPPDELLEAFETLFGAKAESTPRSGARLQRAWLDVSPYLVGSVCFYQILFFRPTSISFRQVVLHARYSMLHISELH